MALIWPHGTPVSWLLCSFVVSPPFSDFFFTFLRNKMFQAYLVLSVTDISLSPRTLVPLNGEWSLETRVWVLHTVSAPGVSLFRGCLWRQSWNIYTYITERQTHKCMCSKILGIMGHILSPLFVYVGFFSNSKKPGFHYPQYIYWLFQA